MKTENKKQLTQNEKNHLLGKKASKLFNEDPNTPKEHKLTYDPNTNSFTKTNGHPLNPLDLTSPIYSELLLKPVKLAIIDQLKINFDDFLFEIIDKFDAINQLYTRQYAGTIVGQDYNPIPNFDNDMNPADPTTYEATWRVNTKRRYGVKTSPVAMIGTAVNPAQIGEFVSLIVKRLTDAKYTEWSKKTAEMLITNKGNHNIVIDTTYGVDGTTPATIEDIFNGVLSLAKIWYSPLPRKIPGLSDDTMLMNKVKTQIMYDIPLEAQMESKLLTKLYHDEYVKSISNVKASLNVKDVDPTSKVEVLVVGKASHSKFFLLEVYDDTFKIVWPATANQITWLHYWADVFSDPRIPSAVFGKGLNSTTWGATTLTSVDKVNGVVTVGNIVFLTLAQIIKGESLSLLSEQETLPEIKTEIIDEEVEKEIEKIVENPIEQEDLFKKVPTTKTELKKWKKSKKGRKK